MDLDCNYFLLGTFESWKYFYRAEDEATAKAKLEKENRELHGQVQEQQDDLESEKEARAKVEKQRRQLNDDLEQLRDSLEESESSTAAQQEIRAKRENELAQLKRTLDEETTSHESALASMKSKHSKVVEDMNEQLESMRKVWLLRDSDGQGAGSSENVPLFSPNWQLRRPGTS